MLETLVAAATFGLSGGMSPGPLLALVVAETLAHGRRAGLAVAVSPLVTDGPIIAIAVLLLGRIESSEAALGLVNLAGGVLLASYGIAGLRGAAPEVAEAAACHSAWGSLAKGVAVNLLNPSPYLFWLTVGAPMLITVHASGRVVAAAFLALFYFGLVGSKAVVAVLVARSREALSGRGYLWANRVLAVVLLGYAGLFIREGVVRLAAG
jgi:threonine/homoserine/homoserine lactone efflux protein